MTDLFLYFKIIYSVGSINGSQMSSSGQNIPVALFISSDVQKHTENISDLFNVDAGLFKKDVSF
jgi:hypothetical protein